MKEVQSKKGKEEPKLKIKPVFFYNVTMGGVDRSDQCFSYYPVARNQQRKYYKKIFRHFSDAQMLYVFWSTHGPKAPYKPPIMNNFYPR